MRDTDGMDLRVVKTLDAIRKAFESMICEMDYGRMTVKELCERARINKKTFYRYYPTLDDLLAELQTEMPREYIERTRGYRMPDDIMAITREFYRFSEEKGPAYERITCARSYRGMRDTMIGVVQNEHWRGNPRFEALDDAEQHVLLTFIGTASTEIYRQWLADGKRVPLDRIVEISATLIGSGIDRMLG